MRHWRLFAGIALVALEGWRFFKWVIDWGGRIEFIGDHLPRVGAVIDYVLNPPISSLLVIAGLALIWWDLKGRPNFPEPHLRRKPDAVAARISFHDFLHVEATKAGWEATGSNKSINYLTRLRQAAVDGDIHFWGKKPTVHADALAHAPLIQIASAYWHDHEIEPLNVLFQDDNSRIHSQSAFDSNKTESERYYDLHLTRKEALNWLQTGGRP